ncbi:MAG: ATP synthase subunit I [Thermodesulfobacteriota bacterium]
MDPYEKIRQTQKKYGSLAMSVSLSVGLALILMAKQPLGKGFILGSIFSIVNFVAMGMTLPYRIGVSRKKATVVSGLSIFSRYIILAVPLFMAIRMDQFNLAATICGVFLIQFLIVAEQVLKLCFPATLKRADD